MVQSVIFVATVGLKLGLSSLGPMVAWMVTGWVFNSVCVCVWGGWGGGDNVFTISCRGFGPWLLSAKCFLEL